MENTSCERNIPRFADHANAPRNNGPLKTFSGHARITGPCGDTMDFWVLVLKGKVERCSFITDGCSHSLACGSMATCLAQGKTLAEAGAIGRQDILDALGDLPDEGEHCALLSANTLHAALKDSEERNHKSHPTKSGQQSSCDSCSKTGCSASTRRPGESDEDFQNRRRCFSFRRRAYSAGSSSVPRVSSQRPPRPQPALSGGQIFSQALETYGSPWVLSLPPSGRRDHDRS